MPFVGRETEIARVHAALRDGRNVVLLGKYGIGRTALLREIARRNAGWRFVFTNFGDGGGTIAAAVLAELLGRSRRALQSEASARQLARAIAAYIPPKRVARVVIVLDNVAKLTRPKLDLVRRLRESERLAFVAVVEPFVPGDDVMRLRAALQPSAVVALDALDAKTSARFFAAAAAEFHLPWSDSDVNALARTVRGYPLEMVLTVRAARRRYAEKRS
jgi:hypothetical protein